MRPPGLDVDKWTSRDVKKDLLTSNNIVFDEAATKAGVVYVFNPLARPETVYHYGKDTTLRCPGTAPRPYEVAKLCGILDVFNGPDSMAEGVKGMGGGQTTSASGSGGQGKGQTTPTANKDGKGDGETTETSSKDGKGPPLSLLETLVHNADILAALAAGNTSGQLNNPNGARHGSTNGTNVGGVDLLPVQAAGAVFAIIKNPFKTGKDFIKTIGEGLAKGNAPVILNPKVLSKELAEQLAAEPTPKALKAAKEAIAAGKEPALESYGKAMAVALQEGKVILPFSRAQIFTAGWGGKFQAHHALEVAMAKKTLGMNEKAIENIPAIVLTDAEHQVITKRLNDVRNEVLKGTGRDVPKPHELWKIYQEAYKDSPNLLKAIKGYFPNVP
jgi:hypothetical protein